MSEEEILKLMKTLDDAWNAGPESPEWETFRKRHVDNVAVYWLGQPESCIEPCIFGFCIEPQEGSDFCIRFSP